MRRHATTHAIDLFQKKDADVAFLVTPWVIRNTLKRYQLSIADFTMLTALGEWQVVEMLSGQKPLNQRLLAIYRTMRQYEADKLAEFRQSCAESPQGCIRRPRFVASNHMSRYAPEDWARIPSTRVAHAIEQCAARQVGMETGAKVEFVDFTPRRYQDWMSEHAVREAIDLGCQSSAR